MNEMPIPTTRYAYETRIDALPEAIRKLGRDNFLVKRHIDCYAAGQWGAAEMMEQLVINLTAENEKLRDMVLEQHNLTLPPFILKTDHVDRT